jgi:hypothetical protein
VLASIGIDGDRACADWTRLYRLPRVTRDGVLQELETVGDPNAIGEWPGNYVVVAPPATPPTPRVTSEVIVTDATGRARAVEILGHAWPSSGRHLAHHALAGGLAHGRWGVQSIAEFLRDVAEVQDSANGDLGKRYETAERAVNRVSADDPVTGWPTLASIVGEEVVHAAREALGLAAVVDDPRVRAMLPTAPAGPSTGAVLGLAGASPVPRPGMIFDGDSRMWFWPASSAPAAPPEGTFARAIYDALLDVQRALGVPEGYDGREPLFTSARTLFGREYPPTPWLVQGLITRGGVAVIGAEPKASKTWLATEIAVAVATATPTCREFPTERGTVAYFFAEDMDKQIRNRLRALLAGRNLDADALGERLHVCPRGKFLDVTRDEDLAWIVASCRALGPIDLLVLDPLRDIHSAEEDKSDQMGPVMRRLRLLGELLGCTVAVVHHAGKATGDTGKRRPGQRLRGSGAIHGSVDSGIYLSDLEGDGSNTFRNAVTSEVKGARSAGRFGLELAVMDDTNGEAVRAVWRADMVQDGAGKEKEKESAQNQADDQAVLGAILREAAKGRYKTTTGWREDDGRALHKVAEKRVALAVRRLETTGLVTLESIHPLTREVLRYSLVMPTPAANGQGGQPCTGL